MKKLMIIALFLTNCSALAMDENQPGSTSYNRFETPKKQEMTDKKGCFDGCRTFATKNPTCCCYAKTACAAAICCGVIAGTASTCLRAACCGK
jgi:hypothetical protein